MADSPENGENILAELFSQFRPEEQKQVEAAEKFATNVINKATRAHETGARIHLLPVCGVVTVFDAYSEVFFVRTDLSSSASIEKFQQQLEGLAEGVLSRYGYEHREAITTARRVAETRAWMLHVALDHRNGLDIIKAAMKQLGINAPRLARDARLLLSRHKPKFKIDRSAVYRITAGDTKKPNSAVLSALITVLKLTPGEAAIVRRDLGGAEKSQ